MRLIILISFFVLPVIFFGCSGANYSGSGGTSYFTSSGDYNQMLFDAVRTNNKEKLNAIIVKDHKVNIQDENGNTPLHIAAVHNFEEIAEILIANGADLNAKDKYGETPLFNAIRFASPDVASVLMMHKADMDVKNNSGELLSSIIMKNASGTAIVKSDVNDELAQNRIVINGNPTYSKYLNKEYLGSRDYKTRDEHLKTLLNSKYIDPKLKTKLKAYYEDRHLTLSKESSVSKEDDRPLSKIQKYVNKVMNDFLTLKDKPIDIPYVVQKPALPEPVSLKKGQFESTKSFRKRVEDAQKQREQEIIALQNEYRKKVEARNEKIKQAEQIAKQREQSIELFKHVFMYDAMNYVFGKFVMTDPEYDADKSLMFVTIKATKANYSKKVALKVPEGHIARDFYENISDIPAKVTFSLNQNSVSISEVEATRGVFIAKADLNAGDFVKPEPMEVVVQNNVKFQEENQKQNPNLIDTGNINIIISEKMKGDYKDDLPKLLVGVSQQPVSNNKWLIAIGAENYDNIDKVIYSERSAEMFEKVSAKTFGIPKSHIYTSIGDKATAGAIKTNLKRLVSNVKDGDTIYFYYSGHGIPIPEQGNEPYILPKDSVPDYIAEEKFFKLQNIYKMLSDSRAKSVVAFVDSCFSGATDGESIIKGVAASRLKAKEVTFDKSKMVVITAGTDRQFSNMYPDKGHRLFSYYVMKSILNGRKDIQTLYNEIYVQVRDTSFDLGGDNRKQEPVLQGNAGLSLR